MIKCIHDQCQWPECDKTCGMVPTGDYVAGSCAEEKLIAHLQKQIESLTNMLHINQQQLAFLSIDLNNNLKRVRSLTNIEEYRPTCPHGNIDCVYDPAYVRRYYPDWWVKLGMPTSCQNCPNGERYDDEDK